MSQSDVQAAARWRRAGSRRGALVRIAAALLPAAVLCAAVSPSAAPQPPDPIVILVSLDGWRWDYLVRTGAPHLSALAARGVRAEALIPVFPTVTFPNHYTIVTGLYPARHGIIGNQMADPAIPERFSLSSDSVRDGRWWGGEPIWVTAARQGRRAAAMFWPGTEAPIDGLRPTYWRRFDAAVPNANRVRQVLDWLALPAAERPSFVTVYFGDLDNLGHAAGPEAPDLAATAARVDTAVGDLVSGVETLGLAAQTTFVVVSDHGMADLSEQRRIYLDDYIDPDRLDVISLTPVLTVAPAAGTTEDEVVNALRGRHPALAVYRRDDTPPDLHFRSHPRIPPVVGIAHEGWTIVARRRPPSGTPPGGAHGYDPRHRSMHGLFIATGPGLRRGLTVPPFENVHIYELLCRLLGIAPAPNDGDPAITSGWMVPPDAARR